ncbi:hypothetical protein GCM10027447_12650 [Glycomyces halotolerans]
MTDHPTPEAIANVSDARAIVAAAMPGLLSELEAAQARLDAAAKLHKPERRYTNPEGECSFDDEEEASDWFDLPIDRLSFFDVCERCGDLETHDSDREYRDSIWPCKTARALGLGEEADDA